MDVDHILDQAIEMIQRRGRLTYRTLKHRQAGLAEQVRVELSVSIEMSRDIEMTFWLPETEAALTTVERY